MSLNSGRSHALSALVVAFNLILQSDDFDKMGTFLRESPLLPDEGVRLISKQTSFSTAPTPDAAIDPITLCCREGRVGMLSVLVEYLLLIDRLEFTIDNALACVEGKRTGLLLATENNHEQCVRLLLASGADPERVSSGMTPLYLASKNGSTSIVKILLNFGADSNFSTFFHRSSPLSAACSAGHCAAARELLKFGARVDLCDFENWTPLYHAFSNGREDCVRLLLAYGADHLSLSAREFLPDAHGGASSEQAARMKGREKCCEILRQWPAKRNQLAAKLCINCLKKENAFALLVDGTPNNDLPPHLFVFKVVEMLKSCEMWSLAEWIMECIGTEIGL